MTDSQHRPVDKTGLSANRRYRETPEVVAAIRRLIRVVGRRLATEDPEDLRLLVELERELREAWVVAITGMRSTGATDGDIGQMLGTTKQAVAQRWPRVVRG